MKSFGFQKPGDRRIDIDKADFAQTETLRLIVKGWRRCIGCGSCTAACTAARFSDFNPRKVQMLARMAQFNQLAAEVAHCQLCGKCRLVCPQDVDTRKLMHELKQLQTVTAP